MAIDPSRGVNVRLIVDFPDLKVLPPNRASGPVGEGLLHRARNHGKAIGDALGQLPPFFDPQKAGVDAAQRAIGRSPHNRIEPEQLALGMRRGVTSHDLGLQGRADEIRRQATYGALGKLDPSKVDGDAMRLLQDVSRRFGDELDAKQLEVLESSPRVTLDDARQALADAFDSQSEKSGAINDYLTVLGNRVAGFDGRSENYQTLGAIRANRNVSDATMEMLQGAVKDGELDSKTLAKYLNDAGTTITRREADEAIERSREKYRSDRGDVYA